MRHVCMLALFTISLLFTSCGGKGNPYSPPGYYSYATAHLPYVEDFIVPEPVYEDEYFEVVLRLSADLDPELLRGFTAQSMVNFCHVPYPPTSTGMRVGAWCWPDDVPVGSDPVTEIHFALNGIPVGYPDGWPAGTYEVEVISAESREWGGVTAEFELTPTFNRRPQSEHAVSRFYTITVLPKPEQELEE